MTLNKLVKNYLLATPSYFKVKNIINSTGKIDHAALRFLKDKNIGTNYQLKPDIYTFDKYNAIARWYSNEDKEIPRLFISRYRGENIPLINNYSDYEKINDINSYLAWTILFEGHINHLALEVDDIEITTEKCIKAGIKMNYEGGLYKVSKDKLLIQTATMSDPVKYTFKDGKMEYLPYAFVELVQRGREGFEQDNAQRIFSSTNLSGNF
jgi:hypothetical protein